MQIIHTLKDITDNIDSYLSDNKIHSFLYIPDNYEVAYDDDNIDKDYCDKNNISYYILPIDSSADIAGPKDAVLFWIIPEDKVTFTLEDLLKSFKDLVDPDGSFCNIDADPGHIMFGSFALTNHVMLNTNQICFGAFHVMIEVNQEHFHHIRKTPQGYEAKGFLEIPESHATREDIISFITNWEKENINADEIVS